MNRSLNILPKLPSEITEKILYEKNLEELIDYILEKFEIFENSNENKENIFSEFFIRKFKFIKDKNNNDHLEPFMNIIILSKRGNRYISLIKRKLVTKSKNISYYESNKTDYTTFDKDTFRILFRLSIKELIEFQEKEKDYKHEYDFKIVNLNTRPSAEYKYYNDVPKDFLSNL